MIPAVLAPAATLLARLGPALARLETRHWVALAGSAALHLGVLLGFNQTPSPLPPPMTFEVKLEPPPAEKPPKQRLAEAKPKADKAKAKPKKRPAKKQATPPQEKEPHTLQAEWKGESRPARDIPAVTLPDARALGVNLANASGRAAPARLASATKQPGAAAPSAAARSSAASQLSEPGGKPGEGAGAASGGDPGIALAAARGLGKTQALSASGGAGAQGSDALAGGAAASGHLATASLSSSAVAGGLNLNVGGGGQSAQGGDSSSASPGAMASGEPAGVRLTLAGVLSSLPALPAGSGSLAGGQLHASASGGAASAGQGSQAALATAAGGGQAARVEVSGSTQAGTGAEPGTGSGRGQAASGGDTPGALASAAPGDATPNARTGTQPASANDGGNTATASRVAAVSAPGAARPTLAASARADRAGQAPAARDKRPGVGDSRGQSATAGQAPKALAGKLAQSLGEADAAPVVAVRGNAGVPRAGAAVTTEAPGTGGTTRGLADAGQAPGPVRLAAATALGGSLPGEVGASAGVSAGVAAPAALSPGEPGSAPRLAVAMPAVPAILEMRPGGARSGFRTPAGGSGGGDSPGTAATALARTAGAEITPLSGRAADAPAFSTAPRQTGLAGGGGHPAVGGTLQGMKVAAVQQIRPDSQAQPLDVLAPSTYCPLPGHVQPDNRPRDTAQEATEKPTYASDNPSFAFPIRAWAYGHEGRVIVRVQVLADGSPGQMWIKQSSGSGILDVDAREQLAKYRFKPARKNGQPVTAWIDVPVDYRLNAESKP